MVITSGDDGDSDYILFRNFHYQYGYKDLLSLKRSRLDIFTPVYINGKLNIGSYGDIYSDSNWLRLNQNHTQNIYTPRMIRADGGFQVDGKWVIHPDGNHIRVGNQRAISGYDEWLSRNSDTN